MMMGLWTWLRGGKKGILDYSADELLREQRVLTREKNQLLKKVERLDREKKEIFQKGVGGKSPELRRSLAQDYELKVAEQQMAARALNIKSKEILTIARIRMVKEAQGDGRLSGKVLSNLDERDMIQMSRLIADDDVTREMYEDKLNEILAATVAEGRSGEQLTGAGRKLMEIWQQMDDGDLADDQEAYEKADRTMRKEVGAADEET
jgi:hypothetical protein